MASVFLDLTSDSTPTDEPIEHDDEVDGGVNAGEAKAEVKCRPTFASVNGHLKKTQEAFEDLKKAVNASTKVVENNFAKLNAKEERRVKLSSRISSINFESAITLNVGGFSYQTGLETLTKHPGSLLANMFSGSITLKQDRRGQYFIDRDGRHFDHILNYLRTGAAPVTSVLESYSKEILCEAEYYGLIGLVQAINAKLNGDDTNISEGSKEEDDISERGIVDETREELCATEKKLKSFLKLLDANLQFLNDATSNHEMVSMKLSNVHFGENVKIDVGGRIFKTSLKTLRREPESFLALMFSEKFNLKKDDSGSFFIERDGTFFHHILNYLRNGKIAENVIEECGQQMQEEAEFYGLSGLKEKIINYKDVKLNVGGRDFVVTREVLKQYPDSMFGRMISGKEGAFKRRQDGSFYIERDGTNFSHILEYLRFGSISDDVVKECGVSLHDDAQFYMLPHLEELVHNYHTVKVDVGGRIFVVSREILSKFPDSMFGMMLAGKDGNYVKRNDGSYFIQHDDVNFNHILNYLRSGTLSDSVIKKHSESLCEDAEFYMLPDLKERINNYFNVKIIIGTSEFLVGRKVLIKFPDSLFGKMLTGGKGDYIKRNDGSYYILRDSDRFPYILRYLNGEMNEVHVDKDLARNLHEDASFYGLPDFSSSIIEKSRMDGSHQQGWGEF